MPEQPSTPGPAATSNLGLPGWGRWPAPEFGEITLGWLSDGAIFLNLDGESPEEAFLARWPGRGADFAERPVPGALSGPLIQYFHGEPVDPATLPVRLHGTKFQIRAWTALRRVGRGEVRTYAGLAKDIGSPRAMRAVGLAMGANPIPILVPCHRVVAQGFGIGGYSGGLAKKRRLLELEGVQIDQDVVRPGQLTLDAL